MSNPTFPELQQKVADALSQATDGRLITRSVVVYESLMDNGERVISVVQSPDCRAWDILGLTQWANELALLMIRSEVTGGRE